MKRFLLLAGIACLAFSCSDQNAVSVTNPENISPTKKKVDPIQQKMDALRTMSPMDLDQMNAFLPKNAGKFVQSGLSANSNMGYSTAECTYRLNKKAVNVQIVDCAGEAGLGWYRDAYLQKLNNPSSGMQTVKFHGDPALLQEEEKLDQRSFRYISKDRLLVMLSSRTMTANELRDFAAYF